MFKTSTLEKGIVIFMKYFQVLFVAANYEIIKEVIMTANTIIIIIIPITTQNRSIKVSIIYFRSPLDAATWQVCSSYQLLLLLLLFIDNLVDIEHRRDKDSKAR